jgi:hypothetical protein
MRRWREQVVRLVLVVALGVGVLVVAPTPASAGGISPVVNLEATEAEVAPGETIHYTVEVENPDNAIPITATDVTSPDAVCVLTSPTTVPPVAAGVVATCEHVARASDTSTSPHAVTVEVTFSDTPATVNDTASNEVVVPVTFPDHGFVDEDEVSFYSDGLEWAAFFQLVAGFNDGTFRADDDVTRGQIVNMLWHQVDEPVVNTPHGFVDVPAGAFYRQALNWAKARGLVTGFSGNRYRPMQPVTRGQLVNMVHKMIGSPPLGSGPGYSDVSRAFRTAARWVRQNDLFDAVAPGAQLQPTLPATRGEVVYLLHGVAEVRFAWVRWNRNPVATMLFDDADVLLQDDRFLLNRATVFAGETVTWHNLDLGSGTVHTVTSDTEAWPELGLVQADAQSISFPAPGTFTYHCEIHPVMTGRVIVQAQP